MYNIEYRRCRRRSPSQQQFHPYFAYRYHGNGIQRKNNYALSTGLFVRVNHLFDSEVAPSKYSQLRGKSVFANCSTTKLNVVRNAVKRKRCSTGIVEVESGNSCTANQNRVDEYDIEKTRTII